MQEIISLVLGQLRNIWRFRWVALGVAWLIALVGWLYVYSLPDQYGSSARVHIDTKSAIDPLLKDMAVTPNADQQASLLIQTVLSRPNLRDIARSTGLDLKVTSSEQEQALIQGMQSRLKLSRSGYRSNNLYTISYTSSDPKLAQSVVQAVMSIMTTMNLSNDNSKKSKHAISLLTREVDKYKKRLSNTEQKLDQFKKEHAEQLPGTNDYVTRVHQINAKIDSTMDQLATARDHKTSIEQQMRSMGKGGPATVSPAQSEQVRHIDNQLAGARQKLSHLLTKYTPKHPDVISTKREISDLEKRRGDTLAHLRAHPGQIQSPNGASSNGGSRARLSVELDNAKTQIKTLESSLDRTQGKLKELRAGSGAMNDAQSKLAELSRNYEITRGQYEKLLSRLYGAQLSSDVQKNVEALQFRVIDPPEVPAKPTGPKRTIMMGVVLIGAIVAGMVFGWFLAQIRPVFSSRRDLTETTGFPVIGSLSLALSPVQRAGRRISASIFLVCCISLLIGFAAALFLMPLGVQWVPNIVSGHIL